jgi:hypothetical protein
MGRKGPELALPFEEIVRDGQMVADLAKLLEEFGAATQALLPQLSEEDVIDAFEQMAAEIESLRDAVLVREAQAFSSHAFWTDDDESEDIT